MSKLFHQIAENIPEHIKERVDNFYGKLAEEYENISFLMPESFKGMPKSYMLACAFHPDIQENWQPQTGDVMVGQTGNVFVISGMFTLVEEFGGPLFYFGTHPCATDSSIMDSNCSFVMNKSGLKHDYSRDALVTHPRYSKISKFRFIPYPHENTYLDFNLFRDTTHIS